MTGTVFAPSLVSVPTVQARPAAVPRPHRAARATRRLAPSPRAAAATTPWRPDVPPAQLFKQGMQRYYSARSAGYDREGALHPTMIDHIVDLAEVQCGQRVLDLCCGTGQFTVRASGAVGPRGTVTAVDFSRPMLDVLAAKRPGLAHDNIALVCADVETVTWPPASVDRIVCASALVLLRDVPATLTTWRTWLAPGGRMVLDGPADTAFAPGLLLEAAARDVGLQWPIAQVLGSEGAARALLAGAGLALRSWTQQQHGSWTTLEGLYAGWGRSLPFIEPVAPPDGLEAFEAAYQARARALMDGRERMWRDGTMNFAVAERAAGVAA